MAALDETALAPAVAQPVAEGARRMMLIALPALAVFAYCLAAPALFRDGDTNWHVAAGRWILAHGAVPRADPFSYTVPGRPWVAHEWGAEALMGLAYLAAGWSGLAILTAAAAALAFALVAAELAPRLGALTVVATLGLMFAASVVLLLARPHVIALPLLAFWLARLLAARRENRPPPLWMIPLMALWANLHGSYIFGLAFTGFFALEAALGAPGPERLRVVARWGGFGLAATAAAMLTPNGVDGLLFPFRIMLMTSLKDVGEWNAVDFGKPSPLEIAMLLALFVMLYRGVRIGAVRLALLLLLFAMTLQHIRQCVILAIAAPMLMAEPLGAVLEPQRAGARPPKASLAGMAAPLAVIALLFLGLAGWRLSRPVVRTDSDFVPVTAFAHVPAALMAQPVFNDYGFGGWLIFNGVRPFIDGRADMYGDAFVQTYIAAERDKDPPAALALLARWKVAWTILTPQSRLAAQLDRTPGWRRLYADKYAVVQARTDALKRLGLVAAPRQAPPAALRPSS